MHLREGIVPMKPYNKVIQLCFLTDKQILSTFEILIADKQTFESLEQYFHHRQFVLDHGDGGDLIQQSL